MTEEEALAKLAALMEPPMDPEVAHSKADDLMVEVLRSLGYCALAEAFHQAQFQFWYA
jgi:hypothetical protein